MTNLGDLRGRALHRVVFGVLIQAPVDLRGLHMEECLRSGPRHVACRFLQDRQLINSFTVDSTCDVATRFPSRWAHAYPRTTSRLA